MPTDPLAELASLFEKANAVPWFGRNRLWVAIDEGCGEPDCWGVWHADSQAPNDKSDTFDIFGECSPKEVCEFVATVWNRFPELLAEVARLRGALVVVASSLRVADEKDWESAHASADSHRLEARQVAELALGETPVSVYGPIEKEHRKAVAEIERLRGEVLKWKAKAEELSEKIGYVEDCGVVNIEGEVVLNEAESAWFREVLKHTTKGQ